jgi:hypothetical protein
MVARELHYRRHTLERIEERYGLFLYDREYEQLCELLRAEKGIYLDRQTVYRELWCIQYRKKVIPVVYDRYIGKIVTVLPEQTRKKYKIKDFYTEQEWARLTYTAEDDRLLMEEELRKYSQFCYQCWIAAPYSGFFCQCYKGT